jgi:glycosidase
MHLLIVRLAHSKGMAIITFDNLGYCSVEGPDFLKACDDVKAGRESREARFFLWSDKADAQPPGNAPGDTFFMVRPTHLPGAKPGAFYDSVKHEFWQYSERAGKYYWTKWAGVDSRGNKVRLPQYNWGSMEFQEEAEKIVRFWMDTGIDGMIIDAVNWYVDHTWEKGRRRMTEVIASYGNSYSQPEGGGGFHEDPVAWITEGGWNSVQDYGLGIWWEKGSDVIESAINSGDPRPIERALRDYHDRVVGAGGVLYHFPSRFREQEKQNLSFAIVASVGDLVAGQYPRDSQVNPEVRRLLATKREHPALQQLSSRRQLPTKADHQHYAFLRTAADKSERILVVMNFQPTPQTVEVDMSGVDTGGLVEMQSNSLIRRLSPLNLELPGFGYRLYRLQPTVRLP